MSLLAAAGAGVVGLVLSFPAASNFLLPGGLLDSGSKSRVRGVVGWAILVLTRAVLLVSRSIPPPIWALIFLFVLFPGILPGAAALGLYTLGVLGRLVAEVTENLDSRPLTALKAQGASGGQVFAYGVLPLTFPRFMAYLLYRWEEAIRATVVIGLVGAGGLGWLLTEQLSSFDYRSVLTTLIVFITIIFIVDMISAAARRAFR
jgi:phosphonate transport system permease protein